MRKSSSAVTLTLLLGTTMMKIDESPVYDPSLECLVFLAAS